MTQLQRIDAYRSTLRRIRDTQGGDKEAHSPSGGGSGGAGPQGGGSGQEGIRQGSREGGTTGGVSTTSSVQTWASVVKHDKRNVAVGEDLADVMIPDGVLIAEGVDDDASDEDCTWKDQLMLLAYSDPTWIPVLQEYLQEEREEAQKLQGERMDRLALWLQATPPALTA